MRGGARQAGDASYAGWRQASDAASEAYRSRAAASRCQRWLVHAAYLAALELEEHAALAYQKRVEQLRGAERGATAERQATGAALPRRLIESLRGGFEARWA